MCFTTRHWIRKWLKSQVFALVNEASNIKKLLLECLTEASVVSGPPDQANRSRASTCVRDPYLCIVMAYDMLAGNGMMGGGAIKRLLKSKAKELESLWGERKASMNTKNALVIHPRYLRINTTRIPLQDAMDDIKRDLNITAHCDASVPDLLIIPPKSISAVLSHEIVTNGIGTVHVSRRQIFPRFTRSCRTSRAV